MKTGATIIIFSLVLLTTTHGVKAQIKRVSGEAQVRVENNMTVNQTRAKAKQLAIINAIENTFGTYVEQQTDMTIKDGMTSYNIIGSTKVKGEWIETTDISYKEHFKKTKTTTGIVNTKYITCYIKGKARKSVPKAAIEYEIMNAPDIHARTNSFYHGEQLYLWFKSPVKGYLSVFLEDNDAVYRLLPYMNMKDDYQNGVPVKSDTDYLFFSPDNNAFPGNPVDELLLTSLKKDVEYNTLYIVFSEDKFVKPVLDNSKVVNTLIIPKQLSKEKFQKWLSNNRALSKRFQDKRIEITIQGLIDKI